MTAVDHGTGESGRSHTPAPQAPEPVAEAPAAAPVGDPMALGLPVFIVGSVALGLSLVGVVPAGTVGAPLAIIMASTAIGLFMATIWAAAVGQSAVACVFGIFAGFWLSYAVLVLGLVHNWFAVTPAAAVSTQELFLTSWLIIVVMLTLATLRLPVAFTALFVLIDAALLVILLSTSQGSAGLGKFGGYLVLAFAALGVYLFFNTASRATGGKALPLGKPLM
jgi:succinate-acetate transporter protein